MQIFQRVGLKRQFNGKTKGGTWQKIHNLLKQLLSERWFVLSQDTQLSLATELSGMSGDFSPLQRQTTSVELTLLYLMPMVLPCWTRAAEMAKRNMSWLGHSASYPVLSKLSPWSQAPQTDHVRSRSGGHPPPQPGPQPLVLPRSSLPLPNTFCATASQISLSETTKSFSR